MRIGTYALNVKTNKARKKGSKETMKRLIALAAIVVGTAAFVGCSTTPQNFVASSKPVLQGRYTTLGDEVEGTDTMVMVLGIPLGFPGSPQKRALHTALEKAAGADALIEMAVDYQMLNLYVVQVMTTRVIGTPVKTNNVGTR